jgi:pimeloyl-ACP methyl ester carboxylesterase
MRTPLVLVPGLMCDDALWSAQTLALSAQHEVIVIDHGDADSLVAMAHSLLSRSPARFVLAGHSMGGRVALEAMRLAPERITHLALLDTGYEPLAPGAPGEQEAAKRHALLEIAQTRGTRAMGQVWSRAMVHPERLEDARLMQSIHDMIGRKTAHHFAAQINALLNRPDASDVLTAIRCPTLVLCGREDAWSPWQRHVDIANRIAGSSLVAIERCGHMSPMERPGEVTEALRQFFAARRAPAR